MVGLNWDDVLVEGNKAGLAYGSIGSYITEKKGQSGDADNNALELWYQYQVTDAISVKLLFSGLITTPAMLTTHLVH